MSASENPIEDILKTAIRREIDAYTLYSNAAKNAQAGPAAEILRDLAAQEVGHRNKLEGLLNGKVFKALSKGQQRQIVDLKITDYLIDVPLTSDSDFQDVLIVAGKREKASHELYEALARIAPSDETRQLFTYLANEELTHKRRVESLYDELVYREN
ncbi:MAG: ferritin family protein [Chloroflexi bacterium]|jgi:rubrerythrin|nr:ferritin family protein [Chloroflexota bacterium]